MHDQEDTMITHACDQLIASGIEDPRNKNNTKTTTTTTTTK